MDTLRKHHLSIAGVLFAIAALLYLAGLGLAAEGVFFLGCAVEIAAWITLSRHLLRPRRADAAKPDKTI